MFFFLVVLCRCCVVLGVLCSFGLMILLIVKLIRVRFVLRIVIMIFGGMNYYYVLWLSVCLDCVLLRMDFYVIDEFGLSFR